MVKDDLNNLEVLRDLHLRNIALGEIQGPPVGFASIDKPWLRYYTEEEVASKFPKMNMYQYLIEKNKDNLDYIALNYYGKRITYKELIDNIELAKKGLASLGIKKGDVVSVAAPFLPETIYSVYALNALGAVVNLVDPRVPSNKLLNYIKGSNSKYLIAYSTCANKIMEIEKESGLKNTVLISATDSLPVGMRELGRIKELLSKKNSYLSDMFIKWNSLMKKNKNTKNIDDIPYEENKPAIIVYTSGTSGEPKGAISSNESFNNIAHSQAISLHETKVGDKFLLIMPPFIAYGIAIGMHGQLCRGQELIMVPTFSIENEKELLGNLVVKHKPQTIMGVPSFMSDLIKHPKIQNVDCSFLKTIIVGGDSMITSSEVAVNNFMQARNSSARICKGWGLTEVNSAFSYTKDRENNLIGSVGIPLIGNNIKVMKADTREEVKFDELEEVGYNETGELYINSKYAILDYLNNEDESKRVFLHSDKTGEDWVRTKDLGKITDNGVIFIEGRMKRIIIRPDGHNISPFAIENIINADSRVESCAVVGRPVGNNEHGSFAIAYIELKKEFLASQKEILREIKKVIDEQLPPRDVASEYKVIDEIPLTSIGKVNYKELEEKEKQLVLKKN